MPVVKVFVKTAIKIKIKIIINLCELWVFCFNAYDYFGANKYTYAKIQPRFYQKFQFNLLIKDTQCQFTSKYFAREKFMNCMLGFSLEDRYFKFIIFF